MKHVDPGEVLKLAVILADFDKLFAALKQVFLRPALPPPPAFAALDDSLSMYCHTMARMHFAGGI